MRTIAITAAAGIVLGSALALILHLTRGPVQAPGLLVCTSEWLRLAPTIGLDEAGKTASVGVTAPGPATCIAPGKGKPSIVIAVDSALGTHLVRVARRRGPVPGSEVHGGFTFSEPVPALKLCKAPQPLHFEVMVDGMKAAGDSPLHFAGGRCFLGG